MFCFRNGIVVVVGIATRDGKVSCQGLFVCEHQSFMTGDKALDRWREGEKG